jgi:hypothetical protein
MKIDINTTPPTASEVADALERVRRRVKLALVVLFSSAGFMFFGGEALAFPATALFFVTGVYLLPRVDRGAFRYAELRPISPDECEAVVEWKGRYPLVERYCEKVKAQGREIIGSEFVAMGRFAKQQSAVDKKTALYGATAEKN